MVRDGLDGRSNCGWNVNVLNVARSVQKEAHLLGIRLIQERAQRNPRAMLASFELKVPFRNAVDTIYQERRCPDERPKSNTWETYVLQERRNSGLWIPAVITYTFL